MMTFSLVQLLSRVRLFVTLWTAACQASLFITNSVDMSLNKLWEIVKDKEDWKAAVGHNLATEKCNRDITLK